MKLLSLLSAGVLFCFTQVSHAACIDPIKHDCPVTSGLNCPSDQNYVSCLATARYDEQPTPKDPFSGCVQQQAQYIIDYTAGGYDSSYSLDGVKITDIQFDHHLQRKFLFFPLSAGSDINFYRFKAMDQERNIFTGMIAVKLGVNKVTDFRNGRIFRYENLCELARSGDYGLRSFEIYNEGGRLLRYRAEETQKSYMTRW